jgi:pre-60S factor REI1
VTKDWFEARKVQLSTAAAAPHTKIWYDPLTKKKFQTQQTYQVGLLVQAAFGLALVLP